MKTIAKRLLTLLAIATTASATFAGSARWSSNPASSDWNTATNWVPATIPNTQADTAAFGTSNLTNLTVGEWSDGSGQTDTMVRGIVFASGADSYTITVTPVPGAYPSILEIFIGGIRNSSGVMQNFVAASSGTYEACARIYFNSFGSAGENVTITNQGGDSADGDSTYGAFTDFDYSSSAGNATLVNQGSTAADTVFGGHTSLLFYASAESATFINNPGTVSRAAAGFRLCKQLVVSATLPLFVIQRWWRGLRAVGLNMIEEHRPELPLILWDPLFPGLKPDRSMFMAAPGTRRLSLTAATAVTRLVA